MDPLPYSNDLSEAPLDLDPRIRRFRCGDEVDTFVVRSERQLVIVDTHSTPDLARQLAELCGAAESDGRLLVVNTHADYDHAWGNQVFSGPTASHPAPVIGHVDCAARLAGDDGGVARAKMEALQPGRFDGLVLTPPSIVVGDAGLAIDGGDLTLTLVHTPGHTEDHFSIWLPELRLALAGDAAEHPFPHVDTPAGLGQARASLVRLQDLDPLHVLPCHGDTIEPDLLARNIAYLDAVVADPDLPLAEAARHRESAGRQPRSDLPRVPCRCVRGEPRSSSGRLGTREEPVDLDHGVAQPDLVRPFEQAPRGAARLRPLEVARVHPLALVVELPDPVVPPGNVEATHEEEVVAPSREVVEGAGRPPEVHLVEELGRVGVRVAEEQRTGRFRETVLVPALQAGDGGELRARPGCVRIAADLGVRAAEFGVPNRVVDGGERARKGRLSGRLCTQQADALDRLGHRRSLRESPRLQRGVDGSE